MADSFIPYGADPGVVGRRTATAKRTETRDGVTGEFHRDEVITVPSRKVTNAIAVTTFRILGAAALTQNLFTVENQAGSGVVLAVRRLSVQLDATAALAAVAPIVKTSRLSALPTGGTVLTKNLYDTDPPASPATVVARGANAADGGAATAITATAGSPLWSQFVMRLHTAASQVSMDDQSLLPQLSEETPLLLREGQSLLVQVVAAATTSNPATNHWVVNCFFEECVL